MKRQDTQESSQMLRTERSIESISKGRIIILFNSSTLQNGCHFMEDILDFDRRINNYQISPSVAEKERETETVSVN